MKLPVDEVQMIVDGDHETAEVVVKELVGKSRWSTRHRLVFSLNEKFYEVAYQLGATEYQDVEPFGYEDEVECHEVERYEKTVVDYRRVK